MRTLSQILLDVNSVLDLEATLPTGTDLTARANYANQAIWDASATGQLSEFKLEYVTATSTLATFPLPTNFREVMQNPRILNNGSWTEYEMVEAESKYDKDSSDYYGYVLGNPSSGYNLILNNPLPNATLSIIYQRFPSGLLTLTDVCELSDPQYVARKVESYVLYSRADQRFPIAESRAEQVLSNLMGREMKGSDGQGRKTKMLFNNPLKDLS